MSVQTSELKPVGSVASVARVVRSPLKVPAWAVVAVVVLAGMYGYVAGRQKPLHHYVPYVGYPLVMDSTTGKACYSSQPKPSEDSLNGSSSIPTDGNGNRIDSIPLCGKE
jgi:hypothetical protein